MEWYIGLFLMVVFATAQDQAWGRGRGGGGGYSRSGSFSSSGSFGGGGGGSRSGGFSESGAASSGNWQANRSSMQSSRQSSAEQMQSSRQSNQATNRDSWQSYGQQQQQNRQNYGQNAQESRQNYGQNAQRNRQNYASDYDNYHYSGSGGGYYHYGESYYRSFQRRGFCRWSVNRRDYRLNLDRCRLRRAGASAPRSLWAASPIIRRAYLVSTGLSREPGDLSGGEPAPVKDCGCKSVQSKSERITRMR